VKRRPDLNQQALEFLPPAPHGPKTLPTSVESAIYCDAEAASLGSRVAASMLDKGLIAVALAIFVWIFHYFVGGEIVLDRHLAPYYIALVAAIAFFYRALWAIAGGETTGMRWVRLRLLNFDGQPPDARERLLWFAASYLSLLAAGAGLLWCLVDEEHLTWHDHISKTFPTVHRPRRTAFQ
jgi:uncharacterized RDD family membrane protein YckC